MNAVKSCYYSLSPLYHAPNIPSEGFRLSSCGETKVRESGKFKVLGYNNLEDTLDDEVVHQKAIKGLHRPGSPEHGVRGEQDIGGLARRASTLHTNATWMYFFRFSCLGKC